VAGSDVVRAEPFDAIELALGRLWLDAAGAPDASPRQVPWPTAERNAAEVRSAALW
jgi:hypothetical protein